PRKIKSMYGPSELVARRLRAALGTKTPFCIAVLRLPEDDHYLIRGVIGADGPRLVDLGVRMERAFGPFIGGVAPAPRGSLAKDIRKFARLRMSSVDPQGYCGIMAAPQVLTLAKTLYEEDAEALCARRGRRKTTPGISSTPALIH